MNQLVELKDYAENYASRGLSVVALSYDAVKLNDKFKRKHQIPYTVLSDEGSKVIRQFNILHEDYYPGTDYNGVPYPGIFLVDGQGVIIDKFAEEGYKNRPDFELISKSVDDFLVQE